MGGLGVCGASWVWQSSISSNEPLQRESFSMADLSAGIKFEGRVHDLVKLEAGFSMFHINRPKHTFFNNSERFKIRLRFMTYTC